MYDTKAEADQKLSGCVVLFNDSPVYIKEAAGVGPKLKLLYTWLKTGEDRSNLIQEKGWEFRNLGSRIGYLNVDLGKDSYVESVYVTRMPVRQAHSTQGLSRKNLKIPRLRGSTRLNLSPSSLPFETIYNQSYFIDMMERKYPCSEEAVDYVRSTPWAQSRAFNRQFSVRRPDIGPYFLEYRGRDVGYLTDSKRWSVADDFEHLKEHLEHLKLRLM